MPKSSIHTSGVIINSQSAADPTYKMFADDGFITCTILSATEPYYLRIKAGTMRKPDASFELLIPHSVVDMIIVNDPDKTIGFSRK